MAEQSVMDTPIFDELVAELKRETASKDTATPKDAPSEAATKDD